MPYQTVRALVPIRHSGKLRVPGQTSGDNAQDFVVEDTVATRLVAAGYVTVVGTSSDEPEDLVPADGMAAIRRGGAIVGMRVPGAGDARFLTTDQDGKLLGKSADAVRGAANNNILNSSIQRIPTATFTEVISSRPAELGSWSWFWVLDTKTAPCITQPLGRYYIFFSPDHATRSGVHMYYTDDLKKPGSWVLYRGGADTGTPVIIYEDLDDTDSRSPALQTETPSVVYDPLADQIRLFYHCINPSYGNGTGSLPNVTDPNGARSGCTAYRASQGTMSALQANPEGTRFTKDRSFALDVFWTLGGHGYGDHTGYFVPFYVRGGWAAYHINGGSVAGAFGLSRAVGGDLGVWRSETRQLARYTHLFRDAGYPNMMVGWNGSSVIETPNGLKILGTGTTPASGTDQGTKVIFCASIADDLRTITGPIQVIAPVVAGGGGAGTNWVPADDGGVMGVYRTDTTVGVCHVKF
jgi:hypothetical protein